MSNIKYVRSCLERIRDDARNVEAPDTPNGMEARLEVIAEMAELALEESTGTADQNEVDASVGRTIRRCIEVNTNAPGDPITMHMHIDSGKIHAMVLDQVPGIDQGAPQEGSGATGEDTGLSARVKALEVRLEALGDGRKDLSPEGAAYLMTIEDAAQRLGGRYLDRDPEAQIRAMCTTFGQLTGWLCDLDRNTLTRPAPDPDDPNGMPTRRELDAARWIGPARDLLERMSRLVRVANSNTRGEAYMGLKQELDACLTQTASLLQEDWLKEEDWDAMIDAAKEQG